MTFRLYIDLGNDAMRTSADLAEILREISMNVMYPRTSAPFAKTDNAGNLLPGWYQTIFDRNGNDVGRYAVKED